MGGPHRVQERELPGELLEQEIARLPHSRIAHDPDPPGLAAELAHQVERPADGSGIGAERDRLGHPDPEGVGHAEDAVFLHPAVAGGDPRRRVRAQHEAVVSLEPPTAEPHLQGPVLLDGAAAEARGAEQFHRFRPGRFGQEGLERPPLCLDHPLTGP